MKIVAQTDNKFETNKNIFLLKQTKKPKLIMIKLETCIGTKIFLSKQNPPKMFWNVEFCCIIYFKCIYASSLSTPCTYFL